MTVRMSGAKWLAKRRMATVPKVCRHEGDALVSAAYSALDSLLGHQCPVCGEYIVGEWSTAGLVTRRLVVVHD